jgi:Protein of unknown function (DUF3014)
MSELEHTPLVHEPRAEPAPPRTPTSSNTVGMVMVGLAGLALGAAGAWWWTRDRAPESTTAADARLATDAPVVAVTEPARVLPPLDQMDTFLRALLGPLSSSQELARWLATDDLIRQLANAIDRVSRGESPSRDLRVLAPAAPFRTSGRGSDLVIDPSSYRRFDALATLVASLEAATIVDVYRTIQPRLDEAYRGLGRSEGGVDPAVLAALDVLVDTPVPAAAVRVRQGPGVTLLFADPELERRPSAQKQLLRMGPDNLARILPRLRAVRTALATSNAG